MKLTLKHPVTVDGVEISAVTVRRPIGRDLVAIGDSLAIVTEYYAAIAPVVAAAQAYIQAVERGETPPDTGEFGKIKPPRSAEYAAMVQLAATLGGLNANAELLDIGDLTAIAMQALNMGE